MGKQTDLCRVQKGKVCLIPALAYALSQGPGALEKFRPEGMGLRWEFTSAETGKHNSFAQCLLNTSGPCTASLLCLPLPDHMTFVPNTLTCPLF